MISPEDIRQQALKWWQPFLRSHILNEPFFPKEIARIGRARPGDITHRFDVLQDEMAALFKESKNETGAGYWVKTAETNFRRTGTHQLPDGIVLETAGDYLHVTRKKTEWERFIRTYDLMINRLPSLRTWALENAVLLTARDTDWEGILAVCQYFIHTPRPELYIRQLPIPVHTKFIEENDSLLQSLLDFLIPGDIRDRGQRKFADRYFLQRDEPLIRIRLLDGHSDISIRLSDFENFSAPHANVVITENKMNFLTLPRLASTMAIWSGGGFKVNCVRNTLWLQVRNILYWGDIDEHGFQILHQLRSYYPQTRSVMMDRAIFDRFGEFVVAGERNKAEKLSGLTEEEADMYEWLKKSYPLNRLEQEKIPQDYVDASLRLVLGSGD